LTLSAQEVDSAATTVLTDSTASSEKEKPKEKHFEYFRIGVDLSKWVRSALTDQYTTSEFLIESIWKPKMHFVGETGFATANNTGENMRFTSSSIFIRAGFDKYFFGKLYKEDLDNAFVGLRLGSALYNRSDAEATLWDPFFGNTIKNIPSDRSLVHWLELTAGFRMELMKNIFIGWNVRGKTFLNPRKIQELTPTYLAGYGVAKKQPNIDYNFYLLYGFGKR
jgi:hypothetical protein